MSKLVNGKKQRHSVDVGVISDDEPHCKQLTHREVLLGLGYSMGRTIGQGTYSKVCVASACIDQIVQKVACKIINRKYIGNEFAQKFLPRELRIIRHLQHRNIITVFNILEVQETIYIFMEYCRYGDLLEFIKDNGVLNEDMARMFFRIARSPIDKTGNCPWMSVPYF